MRGYDPYGAGDIHKPPLSPEALQSKLKHVIRNANERWYEATCANGVKSPEAEYWMGCIVTCQDLYVFFFGWTTDEEELRLGRPFDYLKEE